MTTSAMRDVFKPVRATAPIETDAHWRAAYAICRELRGVACSCEYNVAEPCPRTLMAATAAERVYTEKV